MYATRMQTNSRSVILDPKHKVFADEYLASGNASHAAAKAGFSSRSRGVIGHQLLKRPDIGEYLRVRATEVVGETEDLGARVIKELETMAFASIGDFITVNDDGVPTVDFSNATEEQLKAIASISTKTRSTKDRAGNVTVEADHRFALADKYRGLELLGKHLGLFKEAETRVVVDVADRLLLARRRLADSTGRELLGRDDDWGVGEGV